METVKNFLTGLLVIMLALIILALIFLTWPLLIGLSSMVLSLVAAVLFIIFIFYVITLVGYLTHRLLNLKKKS